RLTAVGPPAQLQLADRFAGRVRELDELSSLLLGDGLPAARLILISGEPGIGKTALVRELHKRSGKKRLFVYGKFDPLHRDLPFRGWIDAFDQFVRCVLTLSEAELAAWKSAILHELESGAEFFASLLPQIERII